MKNIVLIGMPGCGKSTVGSILAQITGRSFSDIDKLIEEAAGKDITKIFSEDGEEKFRFLETQILGEEIKKNELVIATGGGVVTKPENLGLMRQNSIIVFLKRELEELATNGRPLSLKKGIQTLAKQRLPLYEEWSDHIISVEATPQQTAKQIYNKIGVKNENRF